MKKWHLTIDVARCQGCNNCFMACRDEHVGNEWPGYSRPQSYGGARWIELPCNERGQFPAIDVAYRPTRCTHCDDAPCVPRSGGAVYKRPDGIALIDPEKAAGRRDLVDACPYGMIRWNEEYSTPQKCSLCAHLLDAGWDKPRCVQACGPGALSFVCEDDAEFSARAAAEDLQTLHPGKAENTAVCYKNLSRYVSCFIAGSVATERAGVVDCAPGAVATLYKRGDGTPPAARPVAGPMGVPLQTAVTDVFGDFKFDGLPEGSGEYVVRVDLAGRESVECSTSLGRSQSLGTIMVGGETR